MKVLAGLVLTVSGTHSPLASCSGSAAMPRVRGDNPRHPKHVKNPKNTPSNKPPNNDTNPKRRDKSKQ